MKRILPILLLILSVNLAFGQAKKAAIELKVNNLIEQVLSLEKKVNKLEDSIKNESFLTKKIIAQQEFKNQVLEERIQQASDTISNQNTLFDGFGVLYAIITIVIALIGIALPVLTYQFGIKPSQEALKDFENNSDKKMEEFLAKSRNKQIEQAIENIKSDNQELKTNAVTYLSLNQHEGFSSEQLFKLFTILKSDKIDELTKGTIAYTISNRKSDYATEYFKEAIVDPKNINVKYAAARYFANVGIEDYLDVVRKLVSSSADKNTELNTLLVHMASTNKTAVKVLINDKELIDTLDKKDIDMQKLTVENYKTFWQLTDKELEESYLNEKIKKANS